MSAGKVKNLIILILLLVCCFLLALVVPARLEARRRTEENTQRLRRLMQEANVTLTDRVPETLELRAVELAEGGDAYLDAVSALLGEQVLSQQTAYRTEYSSARGVLQLNAGDFTAELYDRAPAESPQAEIETLLARFGVTRFSILQVPDPDGEQYIATPYLYGAPVFSFGLRFSYRDGALTAVSGSLAREDFAVVSGQKRCCSAQDALIAFWGGRLAVGWVGSRLEEVSQGYLAADATRLQPVWRIVTDTETYYVDGLTKAIFRTERG